MEGYVTEVMNVLFHKMWRIIRLAEDILASFWSLIHGVSKFIQILDQICDDTFAFSAPDSLLILQFPIVKPKLVQASVVWNSFTSAQTKNKNLESIQRKFLTFRYNCLLPKGTVMTVFILMFCNSLIYALYVIKELIYLCSS